MGGVGVAGCAGVRGVCGVGGRLGEGGRVAGGSPTISPRLFLSRLLAKTLFSQTIYRGQAPAGAGGGAGAAGRTLSTNWRADKLSTRAPSEALSPARRL